MEWAGQLAPQTGQDMLHRFRGQHRAEMLDHGARVPPELVVDDSVVSNPVLPVIPVSNTVRAAEAMHPSQKWQAEDPPASAANLLVQIAFFAAEAAQPRVQAWPHITPTDEEP